MKFTIYTALVATVTAGTCDHTKMSIKFFDDKDCKKFNEDTTKYWAQFMKDHPDYYDGVKCQTFGGQDKWGYKFTCDKKGLHEEVWESTKCEDVSIATLHIAWDKCQAVPGEKEGQNGWWIPSSEQSFEEEKDILMY